MDHDQEFILDDITSLNSLPSIYTVDSNPPFPCNQQAVANQATSVSEQTPADLSQSKQLVKTTNSDSKDQTHYVE